ncbi:MAG: hypothetical protein JWP45_3036 [Mucilaginibacter sp.]|nr:hypothetical protein [Mucilaginibacter sp.]
MDKFLQNPILLFPSALRDNTSLQYVGKKLYKNIKGFLSILTLGLLLTGLTVKASSAVVPKKADKRRTVSTVPIFSDPAVGANVTFASCTPGTVLVSGSAASESYTFPSGACDGYGFTATVNGTSTVQELLISASGGHNILKFERGAANGVATSGVLKSSSGATFKLTNLSVIPSTNANQTITVTPYQSGVAGTPVTINYVATASLFFTNLTSTDFGTNFDDIDEISISTNSTTGNFGIYGIVTTNPVLPPTTINSINTVASSPTNAATVNYTTTFGAPISGLINTNFSLTTSGVTGASVGTPTTSDGGTTWTVPVSTGTGNGTIVLNLANATGLSPGISTTLPFAGQTYTIDKTAPSVSSINRVNATLNNASSEPFTATFSESVTGVDATDFTVTATGTVASTGISVTPVSASTYTVTVNGVTGDGTLRLDLNSSGTGITDAAGNAISGGFTAGQVYTIDHTPPTITLSAPSVAFTTTGPVSYTVTYADPNFNSSTLTASNISLNTTGTAAGTISVSGSGTTRTATISGITGTGSLSITIAAGTATDLAGNSAPGAGPSGTFTVGPPPLDKLGLDASTPAAGAYSLRLLSSGYTGPLVRITIGSNYYDVYPDASASKSFSLNSPVSAAYSTYNAASTGASGTLLSTVIGVNSATVAIWYDQSGNSLNGLQSNTSTQPEIINAGVIDKSNALPALKFSGTQNMTVTSTAFNTDLSGSVVYNATSANTSSNSPAAWYVMNGIFSSEQPGGVYDFGYGVFNNKFTAGNGPSDNSVATTNNVNDGVTRQNSWTRNNSSGVVDLLTAGTDNHSATLNSGTRTSVPSVSIGSSQTASGATFFNGTISEMALFAIVYNTTQQQTVDNNQVTYYNIQVGPVISSTGTLSGLSTTYGTASASGNFSVSGTNMTAGILVTPPSGYQVSTDNSTFTNSITVGAAGTIAPTTVYIRIAANTPAGNITVANVVLSSSGAINANVSQPQSTVNQAALTVTANNQSKTYGAAIPTLTASYTGFVNGDNSASLTTQPTLTTTATAASPVNTYTITPSGAVDANYAISYVNGTLTIGQAALTVNADNQRKTYGQANPALTITYTGFVNGDTQASLTTAATAATTATAASPVNTYAITPSGAVDNNYAISYVNGTLTIGQAALTVTANNQSKTYGQANPALTITYTGFVNGDTQASLTTAATASTAATIASSVGTYTITPSGAVDNNYTISYVNGTLTIIPCTRILTFNPIGPKTYGNPDFDAGATINTGETIIYSGYNPAVITIVNGKIHITGAGTTTITASLPANPNYANAPSLSQTLVVNKAKQTINFADIPKQNKGAQFDLSTITTASSGLPVTFATADAKIASINGQTLTALRLGTTIITASQAGDANYLAAPDVQQRVVIDDAAGDEILVHQAVSPNGDGINDYLYIEGIKDYPQNRVTLVNRNGVVIFQTYGYDNSNHVFDGHSNLTGALQQGGTYFYKVEFTANGEQKFKTGYFVLKYQ